MDIKWKKFSYSVITKVFAFFIIVLSFTSIITILTNQVGLRDRDFSVVFEENYYLSREFTGDCSNIIDRLKQIAAELKSEEYILAGKTVSEVEIEREVEILFEDFAYNSDLYNPNLNREDNFQIFQEKNSDKIIEVKEKQKERLIQADLKAYKEALQSIEEYQGLIYYAQVGETEFTNSPNKNIGYFLNMPTYLAFDSSNQSVYPEEIANNRYYNWVESSIRQLDYQDKLYIAFTDDYLKPRISHWQENKIYMKDALYQIAGCFIGLLVSLIYLLIVIGKKYDDDYPVIHLTFVDRIYNDLNLFFFFSLILIWLGFINTIYYSEFYALIFPITFFIGVFCLILLLSIVKHLKNKSFMKHSLLYAILHKLFIFIKEIYDSGSIAVKVALIVIGYPLLIVLTFFIFPITIGFAVWLAFKKVKELNAIKEGVKQVKAGHINHRINLTGKGELAKLAQDINSITEGLNKAVEKGIKSERLKTELITNVSHDIRTPLTSIITYVDLLKMEKDEAKVKEYIEVLDQKSQRLKLLTDDLFEAAKASSGNIPVNYEKIDIIALIIQSLGELDDKIKERNLEFRTSYPDEKIIIRADGNLLNRVIENLLSNILKYALEGSRVYIEIIDLDNEIRLIIKNISAYELNISAEELLERFNRADESRTSQGSGLGLSIAKSLVENQMGKFNIEIDGDLFKAIIQIPKA